MSEGVIVAIVASLVTVFIAVAITHNSKKKEK